MYCVFNISIDALNLFVDYAILNYHLTINRFFTDLIEIGAREPEMKDIVLTMVKEARDRMIRYDEAQFGTGGERRGVDVNMASTATVAAVSSERNVGGAHPYNMVNVNLENDASPIAMVPTNFMQVHHPHTHQHQHQHQHPHPHHHYHQHQQQHPHQHPHQQLQHQHSLPALVPQKRGSTSKNPNLDRNPYFMGGGMHVG
jgi:hypothetical protein